MKSGTVIDWPKFEYDDGSSSDKLCVVLNTPKDSCGPYVFCKVTSNPDNKPEKTGCAPNKSLFKIEAKKEYFEKDTWLQFFELKAISINELLVNKFNKGIKPVATLSDLCVRQIVNCLKVCPDVEKNYLKIILENVPAVVKPK